MPIFDYICEACQEVFEEIRKPEEEFCCPLCGELARKMPSHISELSIKNCANPFLGPAGFKGSWGEKQKYLRKTKSIEAGDLIGGSRSGGDLKSMLVKQRKEADKKAKEQTSKNMDAIARKIKSQL